MEDPSINAKKRIPFSFKRDYYQPSVSDFRENSDIADQVAVTGSLVNSIAQVHLAQTNHFPYEKFVQSTMAILKAVESEVSRYYDYWHVTFGIGAKLDLPKGRSLYLTSNVLKDAGKYRIVKRNSHNVVMAIQKIQPPKSLDSDMLKGIVQAFSKPKYRGRIKSGFKKTVGEQIAELDTTYQGLFDERLKMQILASPLLYHVPGLIRSDLFKSWIERALVASKLDPLQTVENIKNNPVKLRSFLDNILSRVAIETFSAISKIITYKALWNVPDKCLDYISGLMKGVVFHGPSREFEEEIGDLMVLFGIRRWMICYIRSLISRKKNSMDRYERKYEELIASAERNCVSILRLHEHYFGGFA